MISIRSRLVKYFLVKKMMRKAFDPFKTSIEDIRKVTDKMGKRIKLPREAVIEKTIINDVHAEWISLKNENSKPKKVIIYAHSGGFCLGLGNNHRDFAFRLSKNTGIKVLAIDYKLAPEHQYPAGRDDCFKCYQWLLDNGYTNKDIILGGDSAGAGLALMTLLSIKESEIPVPNACFFLSMMGGDLTDFDGESYITRKERDPLNSLEFVKEYCRQFTGSHQIKAPIKQDLKGLPDMFIQVGDDEVLLDDSILLAKRAKESGINVKLEIWDGMWHVFQGFSMMVPEAKKAIGSLGKFIIDNFEENPKVECTRSNS